MTPTQVQYRITRVVGEGAFGSVYEGERIGEGISRRVALKLLHATHLGRKVIETRLRDEARMLSLIQHRAIVRVDDLIKIDDAWCVVMEYVEGADLRHLLELGPVPARAALQIAEEVASALHAAYGQAGPEGNPLRLVHRDIKPENIRLTPQGDVKLLDFGIARAEFNAREAATQAAGMGTVVYMSAERFRGEDTHAGDIYALGVTLFELLTGVPPGSSAADIDRRPPGRTLRPQWSWLAELDPDLAALITRMMADEHEHRPTGRECARALAELRLRMPGELLEDWAELALAGTAVRTLSTAPPASRPARAASTLAPKAGASVLQVGQTVGASAAQPLDLPQRRGRLLVAGAAALGLAGVLAAAIAVAVYWGLNLVEPSLVTTAPVAAATPASVPPASVAAQPATPKASSAVTPVTVSSGRSTAHTAASEPPAVGTASPSGAALEAPATATPVSTPAESVEPAPAPSTGRLVVSGPAEVRLDGSGGSTRPGAVVPGRYSATVRFADGTEVTVDGVRVEGGRTTTLKCDESFATCAVSGPR